MRPRRFHVADTMRRSQIFRGRRSGQSPRTAPPGALNRDGVVSATKVGRYVIHAQEFGAGESTILLLHGLSGSSRWWARNIPELSSRYRVVVPDLVGFGRSRTRVRLPDFDTLARLLGAWLEARRIPKVTLVGHSMGGQISIHLAARDPDRLDRLVLVDAAGIPRLLAPRTLLRLAADAAPLWRWGDPAFLPTIAGDALTAGPRALLRSLYHIIQDDVRPLLPRIQVPTLIVWGERDQLVPLAHGVEMRESIPHSRLVVLRGAAHNSMIDRPTDFNRVLIRFMEGEAVGR